MEQKVVLYSKGLLTINGQSNKRHCSKLFYCIHCQKAFQQEKLLNAGALMSFMVISSALLLKQMKG